MKNSSTLSTFALASACLLASCTLQAGKGKSIEITPTRLTILGGLIGCSYLLASREYDKKMKPRYSVKKLTDVQHMISKEYAQNLWYLFYDGFIGQHGKTREGSFGILGTTAYHLMPLKKAAGNVAFAYGLWQLGHKIDKQIMKLAKHKDVEENKPKA